MSTFFDVVTIFYGPETGALRLAGPPVARPPQGNPCVDRESRASADDVKRLIPELSRVLGFSRRLATPSIRLARHLKTVLEWPEGHRFHPFCHRSFEPHGGLPAIPDLPESDQKGAPRLPRQINFHYETRTVVRSAHLLPIVSKPSEHVHRLRQRNGKRWMLGIFGNRTRVASDLARCA